MILKVYLTMQCESNGPKNWRQNPNKCYALKSINIFQLYCAAKHLSEFKRNGGTIINMCVYVGALEREGVRYEWKLQWKFYTVWWFPHYFATAYIEFSRRRRHRGCLLLLFRCNKIPLKLENRAQFSFITKLQNGTNKTKQKQGDRQIKQPSI